MVYSEFGKTVLGVKPPNSALSLSPHGCACAIEPQVPGWSEGLFSPSITMFHGTGLGWDS